MVFGKKKAKSTDAPNSGDASAPLPALEIKQIGIPRDEAQGLSIASRQLPGYPVALILLANAISGRAERILMDYSAQGAVIRFRIDGIWETVPPMDRATADAALVVYKKILGLNPAERRARQDAKFGTNFRDTDWVVSFMSSGVPNGERVLFSIDTKKPTLKTLSDLGMRESMIDSFRGMLNGNKGMVVVSAPPTHGLPTLWRVALENADKFVRDFVSLESKSEADPEIINVTQYTFQPGEGDPPLAHLSKILLKQPDVLILPSLISDEIVETVYEQVATQDKHCITRIQATDSFDAVLQLMTTYRSQAKNILKMVSGVVNQRLIRRLCDRCKQPYQPTPQLLQKLGIPPGRVQKLFNPTIPPPPEQRVDAKGNTIEIEICKKCNGRGYYGRMAVFELLTVDDTMRQAFVKFASAPDQLRAFAKTRNHLSFQEEGILSCALGLTSLQEVQKMVTGK